MLRMLGLRLTRESLKMMPTEMLLVVLTSP